MAASRARLPIGSAPWVLNERNQVEEILQQDVEEFSFSVRNEMEWLNEHMAEIFAPGNLNVVNVFKTPGKLRGRTPYTAKKRANQLNRAPLTDIFAPNPQASSPNKSPVGKSIQFNIAEDVENRQPYRLSPPKPILQPTTRPEPTASNNHIETSDKMDLDHESTSVPNKISHQRQDNGTEAAGTSAPALSDRRRTTNETFVSAEENLAGRKPSEEVEKQDTQVNVLERTVQQDVVQVDSQVESSALSRNELPLEQPEKSASAEDIMDIDDVQSPSDGSSPIKAVVRKSSLTFSALPAREPLAKTSFGPRTSHIDASKSFGGRTSQLGRMTGSRATGGPSQMAATSTNMEVDAVQRPTLDREESETTKIHNKTSTQRLHDKINMLGQSREMRTSKAQQPNTSFDKPLYPQIPNENEKQNTNRVSKIAIKEQPSQVRQVVDDDDEWILPITRGPVTNDAAAPSLLQSRAADFVDQVSNRLAGLHEPESKKTSPSRPFLHKKMASTVELESTSKAIMAPDLTIQKPISVSNPTPILASAARTTTPTVSPPRSPSGRRLLDGPLSASKAKFYSVLKSAKGIFASSAGASAHAKMEALSPGRVKKPVDNPPLSPSADVRATPAMYPNLQQPKALFPTHGSPVMEGRRTRSSTEQKRKELEQRRKVADDLDKAREKERQKAAANAGSKMNSSRPASKMTNGRSGALSRVDAKDSEDDIPPPPPPKTMLPTTQAQRVREQRRVPAPGANKNTASKAKPAPVTIRMPSQRIGHAPPSNALLNQSLHDSLPPPPPPKAGITTKSSGLTAHSNTSTTSIRSNANSAKRAFDAAAKKKEQEAKAVQRKAEQKRDMEQKRAQRLEEERKLEQQRKAAEQQRAQEARKAAQRQAEEAKRLQQQRKDAQQPSSRQNNLASALQQEQAKSNQQAARGDLGGAKPLSKVNLVHDPQRPAVQINPAKPPKRVMQFDDDGATQQRPAVQRNPPSYQQLDAKRRKTNEEEPSQEQERRSVMAPPVRHSNIRKETGKFPHTYLSGHGGNQQQANTSMYVKTVTAQHIQQNKSIHQNEMAKYASGHIPFANAPNAPVASSASASVSVSSSQHPQQQQHKTPARSGAPASAAKSSPFYPPSESIVLPDIATDSEDEDSDNDFQAPSWTASPALRDLLEKQQLVDPQSVFGPIAPLHMDEVFRNKDRQKKFRDRTSSANWGGTDKLTEEERKKDRKAREVLMNDGGWDMLSQKTAMGGSPNV